MICNDYLKLFPQRTTVMIHLTSSLRCTAACQEKEDGLGGPTLYKKRQNCVFEWRILCQEQLGRWLVLCFSEFYQVSFCTSQEKSKQKSDPHFSSCTALCIPTPLPPWKPEKQHILVLVPALRDGSPPSEDGVSKLINLWCCGLNGFPPSPSSASTSEGD